MSSILDALNKLEEEKGLARTQEMVEPETIDPREAVDEMIGRDMMRDKFTMQVNPLTLIVGGLVSVVFVAVVVAVTVTMVLKPVRCPRRITLRYPNTAR